MYFLKKCVALTLILLSSIASAASWFDEWPDIPIPPKINAEWISDNMKHNGRHMQIVKLHGNQPASDTLAFYLQEWENNSPDIKKFGTEKHAVISSLHNSFRGQFLFVLELQASDSTQGVLSVLNLKNEKKHAAEILNADFPPGTTLLSDTLTQDSNTLNRTIVARNLHSLLQIELHFKQKLQISGWDLQRHSLDNSADKKSKLLSFIRDNREMTISLMRDDLDNKGTNIVMVVTQYD